MLKTVDIDLTLFSLSHAIMPIVYFLPSFPIYFSSISFLKKYNITLWKYIYNAWKYKKYNILVHLSLTKDFDYWSHELFLTIRFNSTHFLNISNSLSTWMMFRHTNTSFVWPKKSFNCSCKFNLYTYLKTAFFLT